MTVCEMLSYQTIKIVHASRKEVKLSQALSKHNLTNCKWDLLWSTLFFYLAKACKVIRILWNLIVFCIDMFEES